MSPVSAERHFVYHEPVEARHFAYERVSRMIVMVIVKIRACEVAALLGMAPRDLGGVEAPGGWV